jgi:hypothetical protein
VPDHPRGRRDARILDEVVQDHQLRMAEEYDAYDRAGRELEVAVSSHADLEARLGEMRAQERLAQWSRGGLHLLADKRFNVRAGCRACNQSYFARGLPLLAAECRPALAE